MEYSIACVVVTYNRKKFLKRCLDAIVSQSFKPTAVYITDNASTDGTMDSVKEWGYYECENNGILFKYILNGKNEGGAGGFYLGMKTAHNDGDYDGLWVLDDDGEPDVDCLKYLSEHLDHLDYISPAVISDEDRKTLSFSRDHISYEEFCKRADSSGLVYNLAFPFNGVLFSSHLIDKIGFPKREMFIWGDELNYNTRALKANIIPYTVIKAKHYHPVERRKMEKISENKYVVVDIPDWKLYCSLRNTTYNLRYRKFALLRAPMMAFCTMITYLNYYNKVKKDSSKNALIVDAIISGLIGRFSGLSKYMQKK